MNKILITGCMVLTAFAAIAMPNKKELAKAQRLVEDVTAANLKALKAGKMTAKEVADNHMVLAEKAENDAERYLLLQGAFKLYARCEEYGLAADALVALNREVGEVPPELIVEVVSKEMSRVAGEKAPKVLAVFKAAKRASRYQKERPIIEGELKIKTKDKALLKRYGECLAELGDWYSALTTFSKVDGLVGKNAKGELRQSVPFQELADFWWDYDNQDEMSTYKFHAAELYRKALLDSNFSGLQRERAEERIAYAKNMELYTVGGIASEMTKIVRPTPAKAPNLPKDKDGRMKPLVFDLTDECKMELLNCPAGKFVLNDKGQSCKVTITRPYWLGKFDVSRAEWCAIMGGNMDAHTHPLVRAVGGMNAPMHMIEYTQVDEFCKKLTIRFKSQIPKGYVFRLPSFAEWRYACLANAREHSPWYKAVVNNANIERYGIDFPFIKDMIAKHAKEEPGRWTVSAERLSSWNVPPVCPTVKEANPWGFYGMVGNVERRWVLDKFQPLKDELFSCKEINESGLGTDVSCTFPKFANDLFSWCHGDKGLHVSLKVMGDKPGEISMGGIGWYAFEERARMNSIRLALGPDLVSEWLNKHRNDKTAKSVEILNHVDRQRVKAKQRIEKDREVYSDAERAKIEKLYQQFTNTLDLAIVQTLIDKYPRSNRTGCAVLAAADKKSGPTRENLLKTTVEKFSDCYYEDGTCVGVLARFLLANRYNGTNRTAEARKLLREVVEKYPDAIFHGGTKVVDRIPDWAK